jgi:type 1 fimbria pilin
MKALAWMFLAMACTALAEPAKEAQINVSGNLIVPPCVARFPSTQQVDLGNINLNQLADDSAVATDVPLLFECQPGTKLDLSLSTGIGLASRSILLTSRTALGLLVQLRDKTDKPGIGLGETGTWTVEHEPLTLTLRVKPVSLGKLPETGSYNATLLMKMTYR